MKKIISVALSVLMLLSVAASAFAEERLNDEEQCADEIVQDLEIEVPDYGDYTEAPVIDLPNETAVQMLETDSDFVEFNGAEPIAEDIDFSSAMAIDLEVEDTSTMAASENQAPVAAPEFFVLNPESMRNGQYTTATQFYLATRWNNVDLCYDPEGGPISLIFNNTFPSAYITPLDDPNGTYAGYVIQIFNKGNSLFTFAFTDSYGGMSQVFSLNLGILSRGVFESFDDSLSSSSDVKEHQITVDFSESSSYYLGYLRTGTGGFAVDVFDSDGIKVNQYYNYCGGPNEKQIIKGRIELPKPNGVTGNYTYTVKISTTSSKFVAGDTSYRIAFGEDSQKYYFFEDVSDYLDLPYFRPFPTDDQPNGAYESSFVALSEYGDYYKITATGPETVTLASASAQHRFKILSTDTLETLYDGANLVPYRPKGESKFSFYRATINFEAGQSYYVVVYNTAGTNIKQEYNITVGEKRMIFNNIELNIPATNFVKGITYTWNTTLGTPTGNPGYIECVTYNGTNAGWSFEGGYYSILTPGTSTWRTNMPRYYPDIKFNISAGVTPTRFDGAWQFRITAGETGLFPGNKFKIRYAFEI